MTNDNYVIANGTKMSVERMRQWLQDLHKKPVVLRRYGDTAVVCPYCRMIHHHTEPDGYYRGPTCDPYINAIVVRDITFTPHFGYIIYDYIEGRGVNRGVNSLILPGDYRTVLNTI